ncbi:MAG: DMT family transporter [Chitinophagales bacterium]|nr:DMT family transporter [Chitinophagales bacterium]
MNHKPRLFDWLMLLLLALIWGSSFILMKKGLVAFRAEQVAALRIVITALSLLPFAILRWNEVDFSKKKTILIQGMFGNFIPAFLFTAAQVHIDSSQAGILNSLSPVWVFVLGIFFFQSSYSPIKIVGMAVAFVGSVVLILLQPSHGTTSNAVYGLLIVVATFCYGLSANLLKANLKGVRPITITSISFNIVLIPAAIFLYSTGIIETFNANPDALTSLLYVATLAVFSSAIASIIFNKLVHSTSALFAASVTYLMPIVALSWGFLAGETLSPVDFIGMALIFFGVYLVGK